MRDLRISSAPAKEHLISKSPSFVIEIGISIGTFDHLCHSSLGEAFVSPWRVAGLRRCHVKGCERGSGSERRRRRRRWGWGGCPVLGWNRMDDTEHMENSMVNWMVYT